MELGSPSSSRTFCTTTVQISRAPPAARLAGATRLAVTTTPGPYSAAAPQSAKWLRVAVAAWMARCGSASMTRLDHSICPVPKSRLAGLGSGQGRSVVHSLKARMVETLAPRLVEPPKVGTRVLTVNFSAARASCPTSQEADAEGQASG